MPAIGSAVAKLDPRVLARNPVMFVVAVVSLPDHRPAPARPRRRRGAASASRFQIILWLWFTVLFANFAEAVAEGRGKAQADALRRTRTETQAKLLAGARCRAQRLPPGARHRASRSATS